MRIVALVAILAGAASASAGRPSTPRIQYLLFQAGATMASKGEQGSIDDILATIGETGDHRRRQLGIMFGPLGFDMSDDQLRASIDAAFAIAEEKDVAVGFHIDDSMFWNNRRDLWSDHANVEWRDWDGTAVPHRIIGWVMGGKPVLAPPMCYNSPAIKREAVRVARDVIGARIRRNIDQLRAIGKPYLFAGVIAGWETRMQDDSRDPHVDYGYCALHNLGYGASNPPEDFDKAVEEVVRDWVVLWAKSLRQAGIPRDRIYTHNGVPAAGPPPGLSNAIRDFYKDARPAVTAFNGYSYPGFSLYSDAAQIHKLLKREGGPPWGIAEGTFVSLDGAFTGGARPLGLTAEQYLAGAFNHGAIFVNIFGWGDRSAGGADSPFAKATMAASSIAAYRKFLRGERLREAPAGGPRPSSVADPADAFRGKIERIHADMPSWLQAHPDRQAEATSLLQRLDGYMRANDFPNADETADSLLRLMR